MIQQMAAMTAAPSIKACISVSESTSTSASTSAGTNGNTSGKSDALNTTEKNVFQGLMAKAIHKSSEKSTKQIGEITVNADKDTSEDIVQATLTDGLSLTGLETFSLMMAPPITVDTSAILTNQSGGESPSILALQSLNPLVTESSGQVMTNTTTIASTLLSSVDPASLNPLAATTLVMNSMQTNAAQTNTAQSKIAQTITVQTNTGQELSLVETAEGILPSSQKAVSHSPANPEPVFMSAGEPMTVPTNNTASSSQQSLSGQTQDTGFAQVIAADTLPTDSEVHVADGVFPLAEASDSTVDKKTREQLPASDISTISGSTVSGRILSDSPVVIPISDESSVVDKSVASQVADEIIVNYDENLMEFQMELTPHDLGKVSVKVSMENSMLTISVMADNPKTQSLLLANAGHIQSILQSTVNQPVQVIEQAQNQQMPNYNQSNAQQQNQQEHQRHRQQNETDSQSYQQTTATDDFLSVMQRLRVQMQIA